MANYCCENMNQASKLDCDVHKDEYACPDVLIHYDEIFDEFGIIIHDGGTSVSVISFCPYCGSKLPESKRDRWFDELEAMGYDDPWSQEVPEEYNSSAWYKVK